MKNVLKITLVALSVLIMTNCNKKSSTAGASSLTGLPFNNPAFGNFVRGDSSHNQKTPMGMVGVEGGTFTMGQVQDDIMFDWNTTPKKIHVSSFYMDETEVTNLEYFLYVQHIKSIFPPSNEKYKHIYSSVLPDTLVWKKSLGKTDILSENYFRHPAYADYPVVGVSWIQANKYCKWRTDAVNLKKLIDGGYIKNIFKNKSIRNFFDTEVFLADSNRLFQGDPTVYKKGIISKKEYDPETPHFQGRKITQADGILNLKFRLPTEAEWEFAAKANAENREYNNIRGRKKYSWGEKYTRNSRGRHRGKQLANFKQGHGEYSGVSGWSSDGSAITTKVKSYPPNAIGLYDMSGNVAEWVADVYRPIIDNEANDFNYFRGNIFAKKMIDRDGFVVIADAYDLKGIEYDTLPNGKIVPKQLPGSIKYTPITKDDFTLRRNFSKSNNVDIGDGDIGSSRFYQQSGNKLPNSPVMYDSPRKPTIVIDSITGEKKLINDSRRTTLISNRTRVYKGGSWADREYWLDPSQRRYLPEYMSTDYIGFRCVTDKLGSMSFKKNKKRKP